MRLPTPAAGCKRSRGDEAQAKPSIRQVYLGKPSGSVPGATFSVLRGAFELNKRLPASRMNPQKHRGSFSQVLKNRRFMVLLRYSMVNFAIRPPGPTAHPALLDAKLTAL